MDFEELWNFGKDQNKLVKNGHIMTFNGFGDVKGYDLERADFAQLLENLITKAQKRNKKISNTKRTRVILDAKYLTISSVIFPVGKFENNFVKL